MPHPKKEPRRIPEFKSLDEEAEFWDTHSPLDYPDEFVEDTEIQVARPLRHILLVPLDAATLDRMYAIARKKGMGSAELARTWLLERLKSEAFQVPDTTEHDS